MSATDSIKLHGKFWWDEADNRTHLAVDKLGRAGDLDETLGVLEREFVHAYTQRAGIWWFDMPGGWHDDPAILERMGEFRGFGESNANAWDPPVEIAVLLDDKSTYRLAPESPYLDQANAFLASLPRLGAPYHTYMLSDIPRVPSHKLYIFPDAFDLTETERNAIAALKSAGRSLVFCGPAGVGRIEGGHVDEPPQWSLALTGTGVPQEGEAWSEIQSKDCRVFVSARGNPPLDRILDAAELAGVHLFSRTQDAFYAGHGIVSLHAQAAGEKVLAFEKEVRLRELFPGGQEPQQGRVVTLPFKARETRTFAVEPAR